MHYGNIFMHVVKDDSMRRFLLCDDSSEFNSLFVERITRLYPGEVNIEIVLKPQEYDGEYDFDAYFLDIEMPKMNGFTFAENIIKKHKYALIIFVTGQSHLVYEAFDVHPYDFIVKDTSDERLQKKLEHLEATLVERNTAITVKKAGVLIRILLDEIIYMQKIHNDLYIKTRNQEYNVRTSIKEINKILPKSFFKVDSATIVNLKYVKQYEKGYVILETDEKLALNVRGRKGFRDAFLQYRDF